MVLNYMHFLGIIWFVKELVVLCKASDKSKKNVSSCFGKEEGFYDYYIR